MTREIASIWGSMPLPCVATRIKVRAGGRSTMLGYIGSQFGQEMEEKDAIKEE